MVSSLARPQIIAARFFVLAVLFFFAMPSDTKADLNATLIHDAYWVGSGYGGNYLNASVSVYIDPSITNWIAWHSQTTPYLIGSQEYVGGTTWLGTDDSFNLTITKSGGGSSAFLMDQNSSYGTAFGPQAVIYGTAADSPNVHRWNFSQVHQYIDESGPFTSFFDNQGAGTYTFAFNFYDNYSGSRGIPDMYLLVDDTNVAPIPSAFVLGMLGLGVAGRKLRRRRTA